MIVKAAYGYDVSKEDDPLLQKFEELASQFAKVGETGGTIIDFIPSRRYSHYSSLPSHLTKIRSYLRHRTVRYVPTWLPSWVPGVSVKRYAQHVRAFMEEVMVAPIVELKRKKV